MKRIPLLLLALLIAGAAYAGGFTITTRPAAVAIINSTVTGQLVTTRGHLSAIQYTTVNGVQVVTVTVTP